MTAGMCMMSVPRRLPKWRTRATNSIGIPNRSIITNGVVTSIPRSDAASTQATLGGAATLPRNRLVQRVPVVRGGDAILELVDQRPTGVTVRHDGHTVALSNVRHHMALEAPVRSP